MTKNQQQVIDSFQRRKIFDGYEVRKLDVNESEGSSIISFSAVYGRPGKSCAYHDWFVLGPRGAVRDSGSRFI